jgi:hypothetical protein
LSEDATLVQPLVKRSNFAQLTSWTKLLHEPVADGCTRRLVVERDALGAQLALELLDPSQ